MAHGTISISFKVEDGKDGLKNLAQGLLQSLSFCGCIQT